MASNKLSPEAIKALIQINNHAQTFTPWLPGQLVIAEEAVGAIRTDQQLYKLKANLCRTELTIKSIMIHSRKYPR